MSIEIYYSSNYKELRNQFIQISDKQQRSVFQQNFIFYQAKGVVDRLPLDLAEITGFFGGYHFYPVFNMEKILLKMLGNNIEEEISATELIWAIYKSLGDKDFIANAPEVESYIGKDELRRMLFATKMQETFSGYLEYRSDILAGWENQEICTDNRHESWQAALWRTVLKQNALLKDRSQLTDTLIKQLGLEEKRQKLISRLPVVYFFGISTLSPKTVELLNVLSKLIDIKVFLFSPISERPVSNSIYNYLSKPAVESFEMLAVSVGKENFNFLNSEIKDHNNLKNLQNYILNATENHKLTLLKDDTLIINSCYTPVRELETLYHQLLYLCTKDKNLLPKDILVLIPNLEEYTPFISSVFESGPKNYSFPYNIEKQSFTDRGSELALFETLLNFDQVNFTAEQILQLLENEKLANIFGIFDLQKIRAFLSEANIRYLFKGEGITETETYMVSFQYGLQRLFYGFTLGENTDYQSDGLNFEAAPGEEIFPTGTFNGVSDLVLLSGFYGLITTLNIILEGRKNPKTFNGWIEYLQTSMLEAVFFGELQDDEGDIHGFNSEEVATEKFEKNELWNLISAFAETDKDTDETISFEAFRMLLNTFICTEITQRDKLKGGINFAQYQSVQGLDYKFIAILGLNYDALPRKKQLATFNIMAESRKGDTNLKDTDKYTFLQTILAAQDYLHLSYIGRSPKDNNKRPASILVELILDAFEHGQEIPLAESHFWVQHPLHGFSDKYNDRRYPQLKKFIFDTAERQNIAQKTISEERAEHNNIPLDKIIHYLKNPFKYYLNKGLNIYLEKEAATLPELEIFSVNDYLTEYFLKKDLTDMPATEDYEDKFQEYLRKMKHIGLLPLGKAAEKHVRNTELEIQSIRTQYHQEQNGFDPENISVNIQLSSGVKIISNLTVYGDKQIIFSVSKSSTPKYYMEAWIRHVFAIAAGLEITTVLLLIEEGTKKLSKNCISKKEALDILDSLSSVYLNGTTELLAFDNGVEEDTNFKNYITYKYREAHIKFAYNHNIFDEAKLKSDSFSVSEILKNNFEQVFKD